MKRKIDFVFEEDGRRRKVFRFYPRRSHVHGFGEDCPASWDEVYKNYYTRSVLWQSKRDDDGQWESKTIFEIKSDECSALTYLKRVILDLKYGKSTYAYSLGGSMWRISFSAADFAHRRRPYYEFFVWKRYSGEACYFRLQRKEIRKFIKYLDYINEYMLQHSEPI